MDKKIKVHIFCLKPDICNLIKKSFSQSKYYITCTSAQLVNDDYLNTFKNRFDCIILDADVEKEIINVIKDKFQGIPFIYLPSLESEISYDIGINYVSEPLRLSELEKILDKIFKEEKPHEKTN